MELHEACRNKDLEKVKELVDEGLDVNELDDDGYTPVMHAATRGYEEIVTHLISVRADPNIQLPSTSASPSELEGQTALHMAAQFNRTDVISALLLNGCDASIKDEGGWDAAQLAESEEVEARFILEDWASDEAATRQKLESEATLRKAAANAKDMVDEMQTQVEEMVHNTLASMEDQIASLRTEMDELKADMRESDQRTETAQADILAELAELAGNTVTKEEFLDLQDRAVKVTDDLDGVRGRVGNLERRVGIMAQQQLDAGFEGLGSPGR